MSFGFAVGDFVAAGQLAWDLYHKCYLVIQDAPREFRDLVDSLHSVRIAMHDLEEEVKDENSALSRAGEDRVRNVAAIVGAITRTLKAVEKIVNRYQVIVGPVGDFKSYGLRLWSKVRWTQEVKVIEDLKQKLMFHTSTITLVLLTAGNASLSRLETIMQTLVAPVSPQLNITTDTPRDAISTSHELSDNGTGSSVEIAGTRHIQELDGSQELDGLQELPGGARNLPVELPTEDQSPFYLSDQTSIRELQDTAEETVAVKEILAEAERKFVKHGRTAPSRGNTVKKKPSVKVSITRKPLPTSRSQEPIQTSIAESSGGMHISNLEINSISPPIPAKIPLVLPAAQNERRPSPNTLASSINYKPSSAIEKVLLNYTRIYLGTNKWPSNIKIWLRIAEWWYLKGELSCREHGRLTDQAYADFTKCSWILSDIIRQNDNGFSYDMDGDDFSDYYRLLKRLEINYVQQDPDISVPTSNPDSYKIDLKLLEPKQPEEESGIFVSPHHQDLDIFGREDREHERAVFRSFVALEFGLCRPSQPPHEMARTYLFTLYFSHSSLTAWVYVCNQAGSLGIVKPIDRRNVGPQLDGSNISDWIELEFNGQIIYAGFSSTEAAVPYAVEYNFIRRELLEKPTCVFEITVEEARYMPRGHGVDPIGVGPASLALMEMMKAEDEQSRYREIVMRDHFTTKEIPLHVIKIFRSPNSPVRVQLWWPTFDIPREDLRDYLKFPAQLGRLMYGQQRKDEFYLNPHMRVKPNFSTIFGVFVDIRYRLIEERLLDIDLKARSDRMLDVIFKTPEDATEFIRHAGGTAPRATEQFVFQKVTQNHEIRLFRGIDGEMRLCYKESDIYCNFIVDHFSTYKITPEGNVSLWSIMWSPFGNAQRTNYSYLTDSIDLGIFNTPERDHFISLLTFPEQQVKCASMKVTNFIGVRAGVVGKFARAISNPRSSAQEAMLVLSMFEDFLQATIFGKIQYTDYTNRHGESENMRLTAKVSAYAEKKLDQPKGAPPKLSIRLSVYSATLNSFNRERSILKVAREPKQVAAEIGGLSFVVNDISEWRAGVTRLGLDISIPSKS